MRSPATPPHRALPPRRGGADTGIGAAGLDRARLRLELRLGPALLSALWLALGLTLPTFADPPPDSETALREGNRLFRAGRLEEALEVYAGGWDPRAPDPVLAYNLGTTAHHLGRLPQAVLWYRRAQWAGSGEDRWLRENLDRARRQLGTAAPEAPGLPTILAIHHTALLAFGAILAWVWLGWLWLERRHPTFSAPKPSRPATALGLLALLSFLAGLLLPHSTPRPAVLLQDCGEAADRLAAGSEVWVTDAAAGAFEVRQRDHRLLCSAGMVEPVAR